MSYLISAVIILVAILSFIALFDEAREAIKARQRLRHKSDKDRLIARAAGMTGQMHKMDAMLFQQLVIHIYEDSGYRTKLLAVGKESALLLEKNGFYTLMAYKNHAWPISREAVEIFYYHKTKMGLDAMMVISTGGFNLSAWEWAKDHQEIKLINEDGFVDLCNEIASPPSLEYSA